MGWLSLLQNNLINNKFKQIYLNHIVKTTTNIGKIQISVEKCEKKVSVPFKS